MNLKYKNNNMPQEEFEAMHFPLLEDLEHKQRVMVATLVLIMGEDIQTAITKVTN
jgi:hypothetical protein